MALAIAIPELLVVYLIPIALIAGWCLLVPLVIYVLMRTPLEFDFRYDLLRKYEQKRVLPSGLNLKLSYPWVAKLLLGDNCVQAALLYRLSHFLAKRRPQALAQAVHAFAKFATNLDVSPRAEIGRGVYFYHGLGIVIGKGSHIGERALICQGVTTGGGPRIGDDVCLWLARRSSARCPSATGRRWALTASSSRTYPPTASLAACQRS